MRARKKPFPGVQILGSSAKQKGEPKNENETGEREEERDREGGWGERVLSPLSQVPSSMLRHGLRLICILKSYNDHNFCEKLSEPSKFGSLGKIGNLNFLVT